MKIEVLPIAQCHLLEQSKWWDSRSTRVRVWDAFEKAVDQIREFPRLGRAYGPRPDYRVWRLKGTPYYLLYRILDEHSVIEIADVFTPVSDRPPTV